MPELESGHDAFVRDKAGQTAELGPRALALLRRILLCLERLADIETSDPGKQYEDDAAQFGAPLR